MADEKGVADGEIEEEWKELGEFPGYFVSSEGRIWKEKTNHYLSLTPDKNTGYINVNLWKNGKNNRRGVQRLVAITFIQNPENKPEVDHIDRNSANNRRLNLRWATKKENNANKTKDNPNCTSLKRKVVQLDDAGDIVWDSIEEAAAAHSIHPSGISACCRGKQATCAGSRWIYQDDVEASSDEKWLPFSYKDKPYQVSDQGRIKLTHGGITIGKKAGPYSTFYNLLVHRVVMDAFSPAATGEENFVINHKDGNSRNNSLLNLERISQRANIQHAHATGLTAGALASRRRPVVRIEKNGIETVYESVKAANIANPGAQNTKIVAVCKSKRFTAGGFRWRYVEPDDPESPPIFPREDYTLDDVYESEYIADDDPLWDELDFR